jgi:hypothetical protein
MPIGKGAARGPVALVFLLALALVAAGCQLIAEEPNGTSDDSQRSAMSTAVADLPDYDVAVSAIDFDPPLKKETLVSGETGVKLLAAVENKGTMPLTQLIVEARVTSQKGDFSVHDQVPIDKLSPGETRVVTFTGVAPVQTIPRSPSYQVSVTVRSRQPDVNIRTAGRDVIVRVVDSSSQY